MLLPITRGENLCSSRKVTYKSENIFAYATGSAWTLMSIELYTTVLVAFHPGFQLKVPQYTVTHYILISTETTEQHGNFHLPVFHFLYDRMGRVNMTGKMKGWSVNSPSSQDIVH